MKTISLKIDDSIYQQTETILSRIQKPRNRYINEALAYYNKLQQRELIEKKLKMESTMVASESKNVLADFESVDYGG